MGLKIAEDAGRGSPLGFADGCDRISFFSAGMYSSGGVLIFLPAKRWPAEGIGIPKTPSTIFWLSLGEEAMMVCLRGEAIDMCGTDEDAQPV